MVKQLTREERFCHQYPDAASEFDQNPRTLPDFWVGPCPESPEQSLDFNGRLGQHLTLGSNRALKFVSGPGKNPGFGVWPLSNVLDPRLDAEETLSLGSNTLSRHLLMRMTRMDGKRSDGSLFSKLFFKRSWFSLLFLVL